MAFDSFGYGTAYKQALYDFTQIAGKIAMIPRFANGVWWTRWYDLNTADVLKVVGDFESRDVPLDVLILDMVRANRSFRSRSNCYSVCMGTCEQECVGIWTSSC